MDHSPKASGVVPGLMSSTPFNGQRHLRNGVGPTPAGVLTCWLVVPPNYHHSAEWIYGDCPKFCGEDTASCILARPWGFENTLQGETWPFLYPTQGMCLSNATTVRPRTHPSRYRGPQYHPIQILSTRTRHPYLVVKIKIYI